MKTIGILSLYDESPLWVMSAITSMAPALDHVVVVDGGYSLFPEALERPASSLEVAHAVTEACVSVGLAYTFFRPSSCFVGNEVEKRNLSLRLAEAARESAEDDWYIVFDCDNVAREIADDLRDRLAESGELVAEYGVYGAVDPQRIFDETGLETQEREGLTPVRGVYRALDGLMYGPAHWTVSLPLNGGERFWLWGNPNIHKPYSHDALDLTDLLTLDHRNSQREQGRKTRAIDYYRRRDDLGVEAVSQLWMPGLDGRPVPVP